MKIIAIFAACLVLTGCVATAPTQQAKRPTSADDPSTKCFIDLENDQRFSLLKPYLGSISRTDRATIEQMTNTAKPTEEERKILSVWSFARQTCASLGTAFRAAYAPPGWVAITEAGQSQIMLALAKLYSGEYSYGQFVTERKQVGITTTAKLSDISTADSAARTQQARQEAAQADQALQMFLLQQQQIRQANRPITTSCNRVFDTVNCTTR